jgi:hypothetical protein
LLELSNIHSNVLARIGNTDYVLLRWNAKPGRGWKEPQYYFISIETGHNSVHNGNADAAYDLSRLPGVMNPDAPFQFLHEYYDDQLNLLYNKTLNTLRTTDSKRARDLRTSQQRWLKSATTQCRTMSDSESRANCLLPLTAERVWEIKRLRIDWGLAQKLTNPTSTQDKTHQ